MENHLVSSPGFPFEGRSTICVYRTGGVVNVQELRLNRLWSMERLAAEAGLSLKTVWNAERGEPVRELTIRRLSRALAVAPDDLDVVPAPRRPRK
jgi:transcriptional regulator with XRE-family HTH domain